MAIDVKKIISYAFIELCDEKPLKEISITDILKRSGVGRQTFYNHFHDKHHLIWHIFYTNIFADTAAVSAHPFDYYQLCLVYFRRMQDHRLFLNRIARCEEAVFQLRRYLEDFMHHWISSILTEQLGTKEIPDELAYSAKYFVNAVTRLSMYYITHDLPDSPEQMASYFTCFLPAPLHKYLLFRTGKETSI